MLSLQAQDDFLVVDRSGEGNNCDEHFFSEEHWQVLDPEQHLPR